MSHSTREEERQTKTAFLIRAPTPGIGVRGGLEKVEEVIVTSFGLVAIHSKLSISPTPYKLSLPDSVDTSDGVGDAVRKDLADLVIFDNTTEALDGSSGIAAAAFLRRAIRSADIVLGHSCSFLQQPLQRVGLRIKTKHTRDNSLLGLEKITGPLGGSLAAAGGFFTVVLELKF